MKLNYKAALLLIVSLSSCSEPTPKLSPLAEDAVILAFGDSLTYGSGVNSATQSYPAILEKLSGLAVVNKGIPGEVSQLGLERLPEVLDEIQPKLVILCHGGNDLIRKLGKYQLSDNLNQMITLIKDSGAEVILIAVPNFSLMLNVPELYPELARRHAVPVELTVLPQIERDIKLKSDQIHPNAKGYALMAESVYDILQSSGAL